MVRENQNNPEYDGSTSPRVLINKLISVSSVDNATSRVKIRFDVLQKERDEIEEQRTNEDDETRQIQFVDSDIAKDAEQGRLLEVKKQLDEKRQKLIDERAEEIRNYKPSKKTWA